MNYFQQKFRADFFTAIFELTKRTWLNITYAHLIYTLIFFVIGGAIAAVGIMLAPDLAVFADMFKNPSPEDSILLLQQLSDIFLTPEFITLFIVVFIVVLILASWNYYFAFNAVDNEVKNNSLKFSQLLRASLSYGVVKLIGISLLLNIIIYIMFIAAIMSVAFSGVLAFLLFLVVCVITMRFLLVMPAYVIGNYDLNSSFAYSFYHITWARAFKLFGIGFLVIMALVGASLIVSLLAGLFALIPFIGIVIQMAIQTLFGAIMMALTASTLVGLYYRYAPDLPNLTDNNDLIAELGED
jgi:hypothetical protein